MKEVDGWQSEESTEPELSESVRTVAGSHDEVISLIKDAFSFISTYEGEIPGVSARECGNYLDHDLNEAKIEAAEYLKTLQTFTAADIYYK